MTNLLLEFLFKLTALLLPWAVRRYYGSNRLAEKLKFRVRSEGDGIVFNCGDLPNVRVWIAVTNLSPIDIELDRVFGHVFHGSQLAAFQDLNKRVVKTADEIEFLIETALTGEQVTFLRKNRQQKFDTHLSLSAHINSRLHTFQLRAREVRTRNVEFQNCQV